MKKPKRIRPKLGVHPYYVLIALSEIVIAAGIALLLNWLLETCREPVDMPAEGVQPAPGL